MRALPAALGILLALLLLLAFQRGALAGQTLRVGDVRIPLSPPTTDPRPTPDPARPLRFAGVVARPGGGSPQLTGSVLNDGPPVLADSSMLTISTPDGVLVLDPAPAVPLGTGQRLPIDVQLIGVAPYTPLRLVLAVPGTSAIEMDVPWTP